MPVQVVLPADSTATTTPPGTTTMVEPGFAAALDARARGARPSGTDLAQLRTISLGVMVGTLAGGPCASIGAVMGGPPDPAGLQTAAVSDAWGASSARPGGGRGAGQAVLDAGERYLGVPYEWGGTSAATGFDCSGFVQRLYQDLGIKLAPVSVDQSRAGTEVTGAWARRSPATWSSAWRRSRPNNIGIYAGEGRMLVAPRTGDVVKYRQITRTPDAVRRVL